MDKKEGKILVIDDNEDILYALKLLLKKHVELVHTELNPNKIPPITNICPKIFFMSYAPF